MFEYLHSVYNSVIHQYKPCWGKNKITNYLFVFDLYIPSKNIIIEIDGRQHFQYIENFKNDVDSIKDRDIIKSILAIENNISLIRISQEDVWYNKINWKKLLDDEIAKISCSTESIICYISINNKLYEEHINKMELKKIKGKIKI